MKFVGLLDSVLDLIYCLDIVPFNSERSDPVLWPTPYAEGNVKYFSKIHCDIRNYDLGHQGIFLFLFDRVAAIHSFNLGVHNEVLQSHLRQLVSFKPRCISLGLFQAI